MRPTIDRATREKYRQDISLLIKLSKKCGLTPPSKSRLIRWMDGSNHANQHALLLKQIGILQERLGGNNGS